MPPSVPHITEQLGWEGAIGVGAAIALAAAAVALVATSIWRERRALGARWAAAFFCLRLIAFACVLWMLAGPTRLRVERLERPQSIAVYVDSSASMDVVDPSDPATVVRWAASGDNAGSDSPLAKCDRLGVALAAASIHCERLRQFIAEHRGSSQIEVETTALDATVKRVATLAKEMTSAIDDSALADQSSRLAALTAGTIVGVTDDLRQTLTAKADRTSQEQLISGIESLADALAGAQRRAQTLSDQLATHEASQPSERLATVAGQSRRTQAGSTLDAFETQLAASLAQNVDVKRFRFDQTPTPLAHGGNWKEGLRAAESKELNMAATADSAVGPSASTNLSAVLSQLAGAAATSPVRLAILLTDGRHNDDAAQAPQDVAAELGDLPLYVVPIGNTQRVRDVSLHRAEAPSSVTQGDSAVIDVIVTAQDCDGETTAVVLRREGQEIDRKPVAFSGVRADYRLRFTVPAEELGWQEYVVDVESVADEASTANNFMPVSLEVVSDKIRVLLADGLGRWEYRYLNQLFRREPHIECDELLFLPRVNGTGALADRPQFPREAKDWSRYDIVILGDVNAQQLPAESQRSLDEYVRRHGGRLVLVAGREGMPASFEGGPLMELLPVERSETLLEEQGHSIELTAEGRMHSALAIAAAGQDSEQAWRQTFERFPVYTLSEFCRPKATAHTLLAALPNGAGAVTRDGKAGAVDYAMLSWQRVGAGRVAYLAAPETYRLRFRRGDRMHHRFWGQFLRWMTAADPGAGASMVSIETDRTRYMQGDAVDVTVWLKDATGRALANETIEAEAKAFDGAATTVKLTADPEVDGRYRGVLERLPAGAYQIAPKGPTIDSIAAAAPQDAPPVQATITVQASDNPEMRDTACNRPLLDQLARVTGGQVIPPTAIGEVIELATFTPEVTERVDREPLWNRWSYLLIVSGCLITEWIVRKAKGLV